MDLAATVIDDGALDEFFIERGVETSADLAKTIVGSAIGWGMGSLAGAFSVAAAPILMIAVVTYIGFSSALNVIDEESGYSDLVKRKIAEMLEEYRQNQIRPGNVVRLG